MYFQKTKNLFVFVIMLMLVLPLTSVNHNKYADAAEIDKTTSIAITDNMVADVNSINELTLEENNIDKNYSFGNIVSGSFSISNKKGLYTAAFTPKSGNRLLSFSYGNANMLVSPLNPESVSGNVYNNTITYENIYPYTNIKYTLEPNRLKEDIIVQKYTGKSDFYFQLGISNAVYKDIDGEIQFFVPDTSEPLFYMAKPCVLDKNGNRCDIVYIELLKDGLIKLTVDFEWLKKADYPVIIDPTIYLPETIFTRSSIAFKTDGIQVSNHQPRFEDGKFGQAIMIEEGTINHLTANQSSAETDLTGWTAGGGLSASILKATGGWHGNYSMQCTFNTGDSWVGFTELPFTAGSTYTFSIYAKGTAGKQLSLRYYDGTTESSSVAFTLTDSWQRYKYTFTINSSATTLYTFIRSQNATAQTIYIDGCQLEQSTYATSWMEGSSTRAIETLIIPTASIISANKGSIEISAYIDPAGVHSVNNPNWSMIFVIADVKSSPYHEKNQISIRRNPNTTNWTIWFSNASGDISVIQLGNITTAGWYTFGVTWDACIGGNGYLNSINKGSVAASFLPAAITASDAYIGSWIIGNNQCNQLIDDLRISNRARTADEIQIAYQSNQSLPVDADTTLKLSFDSTLDAYIPLNNYTYDSLNRLNTIVTPNKTINYQYDDNGNLIQRTIN